MTANEHLEQLIQYFFVLTRNRMVEIYGLVDGTKLADAFQHRFRELFDANLDAMPDALAKRHGVNPVFVMALDDVLRSERVTFTLLKEHVLAVYRTMLKELLDQQVEQLESSENAWRDFVNQTKIGNKNNYENEYFQLRVIEDNDSSFGFDIQRCLYFEMLNRNGRPELGSILCEYDHIFSDAVKSWVRFNRDETIADGDSRCTFRFYRVSTER